MNTLRMATALVAVASMLWLCAGCSEAPFQTPCTTGSNHVWSSWGEAFYIGDTNTFAGIPINLDRQQRRKCTVCNLEETRGCR